jgi:hypothetical protein
MHIPVRTILPGLLLALSGVDACAQATVPEATPSTAPAVAQPLAPIDLNLKPVATPLSTSIDLALKPAVPPAPPTGFAVAPAPQAAPAAQAAPGELAAQPATTALQPIQVDPLQSASDEVKRVAQWVTDTRDNGGLPYLLIDKVNAQVFAFNRNGQLQAAAPALLGMTKGDRLVAPNSAMMAQMGPQERVTPAGRFVSRLAIDSHGKELLVLDYAASISLHPVVKGTPQEHRAERLASATAQDNRISFGCINVPVPFYSTVVSPSFTGTKGIVYVLPETRPAIELFAMHPPGTTVSGAQSGATAVSAQASQAMATPVAN